MELYSGPKMANGTCGKTIVTGTIDRGSTVLRRIMDSKLEEHRRIGRPKLQQMNGVVKDLRTRDPKMTDDHQGQTVVEEGSKERRCSLWTVVLLMMIIQNPAQGSMAT
jgi:hypothetical protein